MRQLALIAVAGLAVAVGCERQPVAVLHCSSETTPIHAIQGTAGQSRLVEQGPVKVRGIVTQQVDGLGLYIQSPVEHADADSRTSEGLLVETESRYAVGEDVIFQGLIVERGSGDRTMTAVMPDAAEACGRADLPPAVSLTHSEMNLPQWERLEGMRVKFERPLTVTDVRQLDDSGRLSVSMLGFSTQPTERHRPGPAVRDAQLSLLKSHLFLDDASLAEYPPAPFGIDANDPLPRVGEQLFGVIGVVDGGRDIHVHTSRLERNEQPLPAVPTVGGDVRVASLNVLNLFNGNGRGGSFPTQRGAKTPKELERQLEKLRITITEMNADVVALMELENDGFGVDSAIAQLVRSVNSDSDQPFAVVASPKRLGEDEIAVGLIYRPAVLKLLGDAKTLDQPPFDDANRQPLLQTFRVVNSDLQFSVVVNHFKSKGCREAAGMNLDRGDGQGCWNPVRVEAAEVLSTWVREFAADQALILGDLNAYTGEDPLLALQNAGFINLAAELPPEDRYSFVFRGAAGALDHALATSALAANISGVGIWHINAGAADWLDYRVMPERLDRYAPTPERSSDHDPVIIGIRAAR